MAWVLLRTVTSIDTTDDLLQGSRSGSQLQLVKSQQYHKDTYKRAESILQTEHELEAVLLGIRIPVVPVPVTCVIRLVLDLTSRNSESDCFVGFSSNLT